MHPHLQDQTQQPMALQNLAQHIASLQKRLTEAESKIETTNDRLMDLAKASKERFDRFQSVISHTELSYKKAVGDLRVEISKIGGKMTQQRVVDTKLQELIEKHNSIVGQFENHLSNLKKLISSQDMKLLDIESRVRISESLKR